MKTQLKHGHLQHLSEIISYSANVYDQIEEFEKWFNLYHTHVLMTEWKWQYDKYPNSYVMIKPLCVFDNLNLMALRVKEIISEYINENGYDKDNKPTISVQFSVDELEIRIDSDYQIKMQFIEFNNVSNKTFVEGWKFNI